MMKGHTIVEYRWIVLAKIGAFGLLLAGGLLLTYMVAIEGMPASASAGKTVPQTGIKAAPVVRSATEIRNAEVKAAIVKWMRAKSDMPDEMLSKIYDAAVSRGNADLILAVCVVESNFNPTARSDKGALGLMGIMPQVWLDELRSKGIVAGRRDLYGIAKNIASGAYVLRSYMGITANVQEALTGYVGGDPSYARKVLDELGEIYLVRWSVTKGRAA